MTGWLEGWEVVHATDPGGDVQDNGFARGVLHTTEGASIEGAISAYRSNTGWPLCTVDPTSGRRVQHYPLWTSQRGLEHRSGTVETNRITRAQIEIVAFAADSPSWTQAAKEWLGTQVIRPLSDALSIPLECTVNFPASGAYGDNAPQRMTDAQWLGYVGWCGHMHVPHNSHWDPGGIDMPAILTAARGTQLGEPGDDELNDADKQWILDAINAARDVNVKETRKIATPEADGGFLDKIVDPPVEEVRKLYTDPNYIAAMKAAYPGLNAPPPPAPPTPTPTGLTSPTP